VKFKLVHIARALKSVLLPLRMAPQRPVWGSQGSGSLHTVLHQVLVTAMPGRV
jgi:hypothetical protein